MIWKAKANGLINFQAKVELVHQPLTSGIRGHSYSTSCIVGTRVLLARKKPNFACFLVHEKLGVSLSSLFPHLVPETKQRGILRVEFCFIFLAHQLFYHLRQRFTQTVQANATRGARDPLRAEGYQLHVCPSFPRTSKCKAEQIDGEDL